MEFHSTGPQGCGKTVGRGNVLRVPQYRPERRVGWAESGRQGGTDLGDRDSVVPELDKVTCVTVRDVIQPNLQGQALGLKRCGFWRRDAQGGLSTDVVVGLVAAYSGISPRKRVAIVMSCCVYNAVSTGRGLPGLRPLP
eukprot:1820683-Rhodomonas_salina.5